LKQDKPGLGRYTFRLVDSYGEITNLVNVEKIKKTSKKVEVTNVDTKEVTIYPSVGAAAPNFA
jgi:hypothetical protein